MTVSELLHTQDGVLSAVVQVEDPNERFSVEEYLYAFDQAAWDAGFWLAGRPSWRMQMHQPGAMEVSSCVLPEVRLGQYLGLSAIDAQDPMKRQVVMNRLVKRVVYDSDITVPTLAIDTETDHQWMVLQGRLKKSNITLQQHLARLNKTEQQLYAKLRGYAEQDLKERFVMLAVAQVEGFRVSPEELQAAVQNAKCHGVRMPDRMQLRQKLLVQRAADLIWRNASVALQSVQEEQA